MDGEFLRRPDIEEQAVLPDRGVAGGVDAARAGGRCRRLEAADRPVLGGQCVAGR